ncbi:ribonucleotide reductase small subunit [Campylobacter phage CP39]|nr:ribonucleotide reductase small subunit [Campylobacter phage CP39]
MLLSKKNLVTDRSKEKFFFGEYSGFQRYDWYSHNQLESLDRKQQAQLWFPEEISMIHEPKSFIELPEHNQKQIKANLTFQTLMDSGQNRGLDNILIPLVTSSGLEGCLKTQAYFEYIHSRSYSHIIKSVFPNPTDVFDEYCEYPEIKTRINDEIDTYESLEGSLEENDENKLKILEACLRIQFLEGVKFYVSFLTTYMINKYSAGGNKIPNLTKIIKLINNDEDIHLVIFSFILKTLRSEQHQGFSHLFDDSLSRKARKIAKKVYQDELEWAKYLLSMGPIPGLTIENIDGFLKFFVDDRLKKCGFQPIWNAQKTDLVKEFQEIKNISSENQMLQEVDSITYSKGVMKKDTKLEIYNGETLENELEKILNGEIVNVAS